MNRSRQILAQVRGGDFAHAGEYRAIEMMVGKVLELCPSALNGPTLDVGCGFGGTAMAMHHLGFDKITGIDSDQEAIVYAQKHYSPITFIAGNALQTASFFQSKHFYFLYALNVFYAVPDKLTLLQQLALVAKPQALLVIFDYTGTMTLNVPDLAGKSIYPLSLESIRNDLEKTGWELIESYDLTIEYTKWYHSLLEQFETKKKSLLKEFAKGEIESVQATFVYLLEQLETGSLGGCILYAQPKRFESLGKRGGDRSKGTIRR
jgi:SAM-dependent methyltransferase